MNDRSALVFAFDDHFALGALVCLYSVLRHNPWFDARVIVLGDQLATASRASLERLYPIEFVSTDPALRAVADGAVRRRGIPPNVARRLHALQLFALPGLERAVFLDADTLCLGDLRELYVTESDFAAAPDHVEWRSRWPECASWRIFDADPGIAAFINQGPISSGNRCRSGRVARHGAGTLQRDAWRAWVRLKNSSRASNS